MHDKKHVIGGDSEAGSAEARAEVTSGNMPVKRKVGALVEDETLAGTESGGVVPKGTDGKVDEAATDKRERRN